MASSRELGLATYGPNISLTESMRQGEQLNTKDSTRISRGLELLLLLAALAWTCASLAIAGRAAAGISTRFHLEMILSLLQGLFFVFLVVLGFDLLDRVATRGQYRAQVLQLPRRAGWSREWGVGAALGWGLCLVSVLPLLLSGNMHTHLLLRQDSVLAGVIGLATLLVLALGEELVFRGYPFQRLAGAIGNSSAAVATSLAFGGFLIYSNPPAHFAMALLDGTLLGLILAMAYLRTHALWVGWGLHFFYRAVPAVALGLPVAGRGEFGSVADTYVTGPRWLSGGAFGLDAALLTAFVLLSGMVVLYRATREYAWNYTHREIVAAGYEVTVAPPAQHVAMERAAAAPPPLVQILATTPGTRSAGETTGMPPPPR